MRTGVNQQREILFLHHSSGLTLPNFARRFFSPFLASRLPVALLPAPRHELRRSAVNDAEEWKVYRTRYLVRARRLTAPLSLLDSSGKEQSGNQGDYLVECSDGSHRIAPRQIFEDIYVEMGAPLELRMFPLIRGLRKHHVLTEDDPNQPVLFSLTG